MQMFHNAAIWPGPSAGSVPADTASAGRAAAQTLHNAAISPVAADRFPPADAAPAGQPAAQASANGAAPSGSGGEIVFISGVNYNGVVAPTSFGTWNSDAPATYSDTQSSAFKWGDTTVGTAGGNVTYWFDGPSNWTATERNGFASGLALWSAEANITFSLAPNANSANFIFFRGNGGTAFTSIPNNTPGTIGSSTDGAPNTGVSITIDTSVAGFGPIGGAFNRYGGFAYDTLVHEEGHVLGLGHGGAYNAGDGLGSVPSRQFSAYDNRLWTIMSYIEPSDTTATFYTSDPVTGTRWGNVKDSKGNWRVKDPVDGLLYNNDPTTPMMLDILAAQLVYGKPTSGPLAGGGQTFGFNCNIAGTGTDASIHRYFDFTVNTLPVVTIWDGGTGTWQNGTGNTLDLSGWSLPETISLDPGTFSSANGLVNNIGIAGGTIIETAIGGSGNDTITGNDVSNELRGGAGNDTISGGDSNDGNIADADTLRGGGGADSLDGGAGIDTADYIDSNTGVTVSLLTGTGSGGTAQGDTLVNIEILNGSFFNDTLTGNANTEELHGQGGNDTLIASNTASLYGSFGDDTYVVNNLNFILEFADQGHDTVKSSVRWELGAGSNIEDLVLTGTASVNGFGNELQNHLTGNSGNNYLQGFANNDVLAGGAGNDYYELGDRNFIGQFDDFVYDTVIEGANGGIDFVNVTPVLTGAPGFASNYTLTANVENGALVTVASPVAFDLTGNELDNVLTGSSGVNGNAAYNGLVGLGGNDTLNGLGSLDVLVGGTGNDTYILGDRNFVGQFDDFAYDTVAEDAGAGIDTVIVTPVVDPGGNFASNYTLAANVENGILVGTTAFSLTGNELDNVLTDNNAANRLDGGAGNDTVSFANVTGAGEIVNLSTGNAHPAKGGGGADTLFSIENVIGSPIADTITGDAGANVLNGGLGDDTLNGLAGNDTMIGGAGGDIYFVDSAGDKVIEAVGGGSFDTVRTSVSYRLAARQEIEKLWVVDFGATTAINLTGNEFGQELEGNAGADKLNGLGGADTMTGLGGNDIYYVDNAGDRVIEAAGGGIDTVLASVSYTLSAGREIERLQTASSAGTGAINLTGNEFANTIFGNAGDNVINGGLGNDTLVGLGGNDTFVFSTALSSTNVDRITDFSSGSDMVELSQAIFAAAGPPGTLATTAFHIGTAATDANQRIIYNSAKGALFYDADGTGAAAQTQFAKLQSGLALTNVDFAMA